MLTTRTRLAGDSRGGGNGGERAGPRGGGPRPGQAVSQGEDERGRRGQLRGPAGGGVRAAGAQRGREDDHRGDPHHPGAAHRRDGLCQRGGRGRRPGAGPEPGGGGAPAQQPGPVAVDPPEPALPRRLPRGAGGRAGPAGQRSAGGVRAGRPGRRQAGHVLGRPGPAGDGGPGADARPRGAVPGRADHRAGPGGPAVRLGPGPRPQGQGRDHRADHPRHGRGGRAGRPGRDHGPREAAGPGHPGGADPRAARPDHPRGGGGPGRHLRRGAGGRARRHRRRGAGRARRRRHRAVRSPARAAGPALPARGGAGDGRAGGRAGGPPPGPAHRRDHRRPQPRGRLHRADREGAAMSTTTSPVTTPVRRRPAGGPARAFLAVLWRDLYVTGRELPVFLAQVVLQPLFLLFVFGKVLADLGFTQPGYTRVLFPGIVALTAVVTGLQSTAFPLVIDFSFTKEIEDRLLAPLPVGLVAVEKVVFASMRALLAALVMLPIGVWVLGSIPWPASGVPLFVTVLVLGCLVGSCLGMIMGTAVPPNRINVMFALVLTPLLFTGASQYPWASLDNLRWFQVVTALNPMTYVSEGMRAALVPEVPHIRPWVSVLVLVATIVVSLAVGIRLFLRRAVD